MERDIYRHIMNGSMPDAVACARCLMPDIVDDPAPIQIMWACVIAACSTNKNNSLRYMADAFDLGEAGQIPPALVVIRTLAQAINDDDPYNIRQMVDCIRATAPDTSRAQLADILSLMIFEPSLTDIDGMSALFTATAGMMPLPRQAKTIH